MREYQLIPTECSTAVIAAIQALYPQITQRGCEELFNAILEAAGEPLPDDSEAKAACDEIACLWNREWDRVSPV